GGWPAAVQNAPPLEPGTSYLSVSVNTRLDVVARVGPTSTYVSFARGCAGSRPTSKLVPRDTPRIGGTLEVTAFALPHDVAIMLFGWSRRQTPLPLASFGAPGCSAFVGADSTYLIAGQDHHASSRLAIPDVPDLI